MTRQGDIDIKKRMGGPTTGCGVGAGDRGGPLGAVGVDDSSNKAKRQGSSMAEHPVCTGEVPGYIPCLILSFLFLQRLPFRSVPYGGYIVQWKRVGSHHEFPFVSREPNYL